MFRDFRRPAAPTLVPTLWRLSFVGLIALGLLLAGKTPAHAQTPPQNQMAKILADWKAREAEIRSLRMTWTQEKLIPRGSMPKLGPEVLNRPPDDAVVPPEDVRMLVTHVLEIDGDRVRHQFSGHSWDLPSNEQTTVEETRVWDGETNSSFHNLGAAPYPYGTIEGERMHFTFTNNVELLVARLFARPLMPAFEGLVRPGLLRSTPRIGTVDDRRCVILEQKQPGRRPGKGPAFYYEIWVDPERSSLPVRWLMFAGGGIHSDLRISYSQSPTGAWQPSTWTLRRGSGMSNDLSEAITATVDEFELNPDLPPSTFTFEYPPGTMVGDKRLGLRPQFHVVRADGTRRDLQPGESGADYSKLILPRSSWYSAMIWVIAVACCIAGAAAAWRWRSR